MSFESEIQLLESEWSPDDGFFWQLRQGRFEPAEFQRAVQKVRSVSIPEEAELPRRLVALLWYIPLFMQWQSERVQESGGNVAAYARAIIAMTNEIEGLLGVP